MLDKVISVQRLLGLEESVHSWLPVTSEVTASSTWSSEQLAAHIAHAERLPPLKTKVAAVKSADECEHKAERLMRGSNQWAAWVTCMDCHSRWALPMSSKKPAKKKKEAASSAEKEKGVQSEEATTIAAALKRECLVLRKSEASQAIQLSEQRTLMGQWTEELQQKVAVDQEMMLAEQRKHRVEMDQLREALEVRDIMMSEFACMAMGQEYQEHKGYHDAEMHAYAHRRWEEQKEMAQLEALQREIARANSSSASRADPSDEEWDAVMHQRSGRSESQRTRVKNAATSKNRTHSKSKRHGFD